MKRKEEVNNLKGKYNNNNNNDHGSVSGMRFEEQSLLPRTFLYWKVLIDISLRSANTREVREVVINKGCEKIISKKGCEKIIISI